MVQTRARGISVCAISALLTSLLCAQDPATTPAQGGATSRSASRPASRPSTAADWAPLLRYCPADFETMLATTSDADISWRPTYDDLPSPPKGTAPRAADRNVLVARSFAIGKPEELKAEWISVSEYAGDAPPLPTSGPGAIWIRDDADAVTPCVTSKRDGTAPAVDKEPTWKAVVDRRFRITTNRRELMVGALLRKGPTPEACSTRAGIAPIGIDWTRPLMIARRYDRRSQDDHTSPLRSKEPGLFMIPQCEIARMTYTTEGRALAPATIRAATTERALALDFFRAALYEGIAFDVSMVSAHGELATFSVKDHVPTDGRPSRQNPDPDDDEPPIDEHQLAQGLAVLHLMGWNAYF